MSNYPVGLDTPGFVYNRDRDLPMVAYNNAKAAGYLTAAAASSTTVANVDVRAGDIVILTAKNLLAAQALNGEGGGAGVYVSATALGGFTITHNIANAGAIFYYSVFRNF